jgi:hypothetical protein
VRTLAAVLVAVVLTACSGGGDEPTPEPSTTTAPEPTTTVSSTTVDVEVVDGKVTGGMKRVEVPLGDTVRLSVRSDVADEVHVHGYDESAHIDAGGGIILTFVADVPGVFEVELEERKIALVELEVR